MLAYILALAVVFFSLALYMTAFFFPEVHRKGDFIWSGVGLFYALVLWVCSGRITGGVLLGQVAGVAMLGWSVTQTLLLRRQLTPHLLQTAAPSAEEVKSTVKEKVAKSSIFSKLSQLTKRGSNSAATAKDRLQQITEQTPTDATTSTNNSIQIIDNRSSTPTSPATESTTEDVSEVASPEIAPTQEIQVTESTFDTAVETPESPVVDPTATETTSDVSEELVRPDPPEPELIDAALKDAEEKHQEASPPEPETPENPSPS